MKLSDPRPPVKYFFLLLFRVNARFIWKYRYNNIVKILNIWMRIVISFSSLYICRPTSLKFICTYLMWTLSSALTWEINGENRSEDDCYYYYYYYHCCFCCYFWWWYLLLGLLVLRISLSSLYKVRWSVTAKCNSFFIAKCGVITKWDSYYKVRQFYHKVRQVLQRATIITMWGRTNTRIFLYVQKKPSSETIQFTTAILFALPA